MTSKSYRNLALLPLYAILLARGARADGGTAAVVGFSFVDLLRVVAYLSLTWIVGYLFRLVLLPELIGNVLVGILLGPNLLNLPGRFSESLMLIGELGFVLLLLEGGLEVQLSVMQALAVRAALVALTGAACVCLLGTGVGVFIVGLSGKAGFAAATILVPMSTSVVLAVFRQWDVLSTVTGQLVLASAVLDDIIGLILLSELKALEVNSTVNIFVPIFTSLGYLLVLGFIFIRFWPPFLQKHLLPRVPPKYRSRFLLSLCLALAVGLSAAMEYSHASRYLGTFLAGLAFCNVPTMHEKVWGRQMRHIQRWLIRIFFAATIAFEIKIRELFSGAVVIRALAYLLPTFIKFIVAVYAQPLSEWAKLGTAMTSRGEMSFVLNRQAYTALGLIDATTSNAVILDVLLMIVFVPIALGVLFKVEDARQKREMARRTLARPSVALERQVFYRLGLLVSNRFQIVDHFMSTVHRLGLKIIDVRIDYVPEEELAHIDAFVSDDLEQPLPVGFLETLLSQYGHTLHDREDETPTGNASVRGGSALVSRGSMHMAAAATASMSIPEGSALDVSVGPAFEGARARLEERIEAIWTSLDEAMAKDDPEALAGSARLRKKLQSISALLGLAPPPALTTQMLDGLAEEVGPGLLVALWLPWADIVPDPSPEPEPPLPRTHDHGAGPARRAAEPEPGVAAGEDAGTEGEGAPRLSRFRPGASHRHRQAQANGSSSSTPLAIVHEPAAASPAIVRPSAKALARSSLTGGVGVLPPAAVPGTAVQILARQSLNASNLFRPSSAAGAQARGGLLRISGNPAAAAAAPDISAAGAGASTAPALPPIFSGRVQMDSEIELAIGQSPRRPSEAPAPSQALALEVQEAQQESEAIPTPSRGAASASRADLHGRSPSTIAAQSGRGRSPAMTTPSMVEILSLRRSDAHVGARVLSRLAAFFRLTGGARTPPSVPAAAAAPAGPGRAAAASAVRDAVRLATMPPQQAGPSGSIDRTGVPAAGPSSARAAPGPRDLLGRPWKRLRQRLEASRSAQRRPRWRQVQGAASNLEAPGAEGPLGLATMDDADREDPGRLPTGLYDAFEIRHRPPHAHAVGPGQ